FLPRQLAQGTPSPPPCNPLDRHWLGAACAAQPMPPRFGDALAALGETRPGAPRPDIPGIALPEIAWDLAAALLADAWNANTALLGGAARRARDQAEGEGLRAQVAAARDAQAAAEAASEALRAELAALTRHVEARLRVLSWQFAGRMVEQLERTAVAAALQDHAAKLRGRGGPSN
ncbi:hypothetical protein APUTEX25_000885, partial [Auxenochlorella protothecoides]